MRTARAFVPLTLAVIACQPAARYLVTERAIDVGDGIRLCIGVAPADKDAVWWWRPGATGCDSRSTGPGVFHAEGATVSRSTPARRTAVGFRLGTHSATRPFIDVRLVVENGRMRAVESGASVALLPRESLDLPEAPPGGQR